MFRCGQVHACALAEIWGGDGGGVQMPAPHLSAAEKKRITVLSLRK